jgi:hypothetical protein
MIRINLLPEGHRQKEKTPLKFFAVVASSVAVNGAFIAFLAWTSFGVKASVQSELSVINDIHEGLQPQVEYHRTLEKESAFYAAHEDTLESLREERVSWTEQMDHLIDVINDGGDQERYLIWLGGLKISQTRGGRSGQAAGSLTASAHSGTADLINVTEFLQDVKQSGMNEYFHEPSPATGNASIKDDNLQPAEIWDFPFDMKLKAAEERKAK